ncbi:glycosyltransferase [Hansschlegelia quercus]|nr:glycosyltransferase [Hansschlegelia quercus]
MDGRRHVGLFMYGLSGGGVPRRVITLANALAERDWRVDLLVVDASGDLRSTVNPAVRVLEIGGWLARLPFVRSKRRRQFALTVRPLVRYLRREAPDVLFSADNYANFAAIEARQEADVAVGLVVSQRNNASAYAAKKSGLIERIRGLYPLADQIVTVSQGVAEDMAALGLPRAKIRTIYNPVLGPAFEAAAATEVSHSWFAVPGRPLIVAAGRVGVQKNFDMLIRAFAGLRGRGVNARLLILGGDDKPGARDELKALASSLGVGEDVDLPGAVPLAVPYLARADLFVLSSRWEGLPGVLIEAIGCGTPVVSTDCPSGPREILDGGVYGRLTPVGDADAMTQAMAATLSEPRDPERLRRRAELFATDVAVARYETLFEEMSPREAALSPSAA